MVGFLKEQWGLWLPNWHPIPRLKDGCLVPGLNAHPMFTILWLNWQKRDSGMSRNWREKRGEEEGEVRVMCQLCLFSQVKFDEV